MEKSGYEERNVVPSAPPSYDDAMATVNQIHQSKNYEYSGMQGAPPLPPANPAPVISQQPIIINQSVGMNTTSLIPVGPKPIRVMCPHCQNHVQTKTSVKNGCCCKCCVCLLLFVSGVCLLCSFLPFCMCTTRVTHTCPNCNAVLGSYVS